MRTARRNRSPRSRGAQRGATLLVGLIMLVLLTLHALSSHKTSAVQLRIVGNMQDRQDAQAAANLALGQVLSSEAFIFRAAEVAAAPLDVDLDGDGAADYRVRVTPTCTARRPIKSVELDPGLPEDFQCIAGTAFGGTSLCAASHWNLQAVATPAAGVAATGAAAELHQGARVRLESGPAGTLC